MSREQEEQQVNQRKSLKVRSPIIQQEELQQKTGCPIIQREELQQKAGCRQSLSIIYSIISDTWSLPKPKLQQQIAELKNEVRRQTELKVAYKCRLDRMQDYLMHCLEIARDNGFLDRVSAIDQQNYSLGPEIRPKVSATVKDPHLAAITYQAIHNGWSIEPHEITMQETIGQGTTAEIYRGNWRGLDVAVKWINPQYFEPNEGGEAWFAQELETLSRQRHPFVLRFLGACLLPPEKAWVVTELLSGQTLGEWLHGLSTQRTRDSNPSMHGKKVM